MLRSTGLTLFQLPSDVKLEIATHCDVTSLMNVKKIKNETITKIVCHNSFWIERIHAEFTDQITMQYEQTSKDFYIDAYKLKRQISLALVNQHSTREEFYLLFQKIIKSGYEKLIPMLIGKININLKFPADVNNTFLLSAAAAGHSRAMVTLMNYGADQTAIGAAKEIKELYRILKHDISLYDTKTIWHKNQGMSLLMTAVSSKNMDCIKEVIDRIPLPVKDRQVNYQSLFSGNTALHIAAQNKDLDAIKLLIAHGANRTTINKQDQLPADLAKSKYVKEFLIPPHRRLGLR